MGILKICAVAVICAMCCMILKKLDGTLSNLTSIVCACLLAGTAVSGAAEIVSFVKEISSDTPVSSYLTYVWKCVGVMFITEYSAQVCEEAGEGTLAKSLCIVGRIEMTVIALPLFSELAGLASGLLGG